MGRKTKADPTGQALNRKRADVALRKRLAIAERSIKGLVSTIPHTTRRQAKIVNAETEVIYDYTYSDVAQLALQDQINTILDEQLLETQDDDIMPVFWFWKSDIELPYRQGTVEEVRDFNQMVTAAVIAGALTLEFGAQVPSIAQVLLSAAYREALTSAQLTGFNSVKVLSERTASQVIRVINTGIAAGNSPASIAKQITDRFNVAESDAKRIAKTEVNQAYNNAKMDATKKLAAQTGLRPAVLHISALIPTTRPNHAARHGNAYTIEDQLSWWDSGSERINCLCSIRSILIDKDGNVVQSKIQAEIKQERSFFG